VIAGECDVFYDATPGPYQAAMKAENIRLLEELVDTLSVPQQRLLFLHYDCQSTFESIAGEMGCSPAEACQMHIRAIAALRREFEMRGVNQFRHIA
jgi:DNA-directed RNA polymerase specialized sigma24 family protein